MSFGGFNFGGGGGTSGGNHSQTLSFIKPINLPKISQFPGFGSSGFGSSSGFGGTQSKSPTLHHSTNPKINQTNFSGTLNTTQSSGGLFGSTGSFGGNFKIN